MKKIMILGLGLLALASCKKEGCIDVDATNYNADAKKDDGTCTYEGKTVFWYNETASTNLTADGATSLTYYVNGEVVGSGAANVYWTAAPDCGQDASITVTKSLGGSKTSAYTYSVKDQTGWEYWSGSVTFEANTCIKQQLTW